MSASLASSTETSDEIRRTSPMERNNNAEVSRTRRRGQHVYESREQSALSSSSSSSSNNNNNNNNNSSSNSDNCENDDNSDLDEQQQQQLESLPPAFPTWEFEKRMLVAAADKREEMLQKQVDELTDDRKSLLKRIQILEQQQKLNKIKLEVRGSRSSDSADNQDELQSCKQEIFVLQTDLRKMDSELNNQQKVFVGIISGLRQDFWDAVGKYINGRNTERTFGPTAANKLRALGERLGKIFESAAFGQLAQLRDQLPDNYRAKDRDVSAAPVRKLSVPYIARSAMANRDRRSSQCRPISALDLAQDNHRKNKESLDADGSADDQAGVKPNKDLSPPLINAATRSVNYTKVLGLFPHITQSAVQQHWKNFTKFDENKDFCLDLQELVDASKDVFGDKYSAVQIQELLFEADRDRSNKIDFYEYLTVASMIARKEGRSQLFKTPLDAEQRRSVARSCLVM